MTDPERVERVPGQQSPVRLAATVLDDAELGDALELWYQARVLMPVAQATRPDQAEALLLARARGILRLHGHGIGAACLPNCWDPQRRADNLNPPDPGDDR